MNLGAYTLSNDEPATAELAKGRSTGSRRPTDSVRRLGRIRLPIAGPYRPWATAYRLPDGRVTWCVRLWVVDRPRTHCVPTTVLLAFCRRSGLPGLAAEVAAIGGR